MWYIGTDTSVEVSNFFFLLQILLGTIPHWFSLSIHSCLSKTRPSQTKGSDPHKLQPLPNRQWISPLRREASNRVFVPRPWNVRWHSVLEISSTWSDLAWKMFAAFMNMPDSCYFCRFSSQLLLSCVSDQSLPHPVKRTSVFVFLYSFAQCHVPSFHQFSWVWVPSWLPLLFLCMMLLMCWHCGGPSAN